MIRKSYSRLITLAVGLLIVSLVMASCSQKSSTILKASSPTVRIAGVGAAVKDKIYFIGGIDTEGSAVPLVEEYDPLKDEWITEAPMPTARGGAAAVVIDEYIYVLGGRRDNDVLASVERYDPSSESWAKCSPMRTARWHLMAAGVEGKIYALGGIAGVGDQRRVLDVVEVYDPEKDMWVRLGSMPVGKSNAAVAVLGNKIYIVSGRLGAGPAGSTTSMVYLYDPDSDTWHETSPVKNARTGSEAAVLDSKIYLIGGASEGKPTASIEVYDPQTDGWTTSLALRQPRSDHNCIVVGNSIYIMGGASRPSFNAFLKSVEELTPGSLTPANR